MTFSRSSGILLHPSSLPGWFGIGDLGPEAYAFADFLSATGQSLWQMLPLGPTGYGDSPYACYSAFGGNTLLISPNRLAADGLLGREDLAGVPESSDGRVDFEAALKFKGLVLRQAFISFKREGDQDIQVAFEDFCRRNAGWLEDYALFRALKDQQSGIAWNQWDAALARRETGAIHLAREELSEQ